MRLVWMVVGLVLLAPASAGAAETDARIADYCRNLYGDALDARRACIDEQRIAADRVMSWARQTKKDPDARQLHGACAKATRLNNCGYQWPEQYACIDAEVAALTKLNEERERAKKDDFTQNIIELCTAKQDPRATDAYRRLNQCLVIQRKAGEKVSEMYRFFQPDSSEREIINRCAQRLRGQDGTYDWPKVQSCADIELRAAAALKK